MIHGLDVVQRRREIHLAVRLDHGDGISGPRFDDVDEVPLGVVMQADRVSDGQAGIPAQGGLEYRARVGDVEEVRGVRAELDEGALG